jgi:RsmE family RNA methyltransferase
MIDGLSQSGVYTRIPTFSLEKYNAIDQYQTLNGQKFILDLKAQETFDDYPLDFKHPITLAIGPERGWVKNEIATFNAAGFKSVKISSSILRVEHAFYSAVSQLELKKLKLEAFSC